MKKSNPYKIRICLKEAESFFNEIREIFQIEISKSMQKDEKNKF